ncbi:hypothetical protein MTR67_014009 [Solanum verrucosum]|uniref:Trafficking protein particle complex subunit n=1 Tax=Solanum verrucosum TaxID=315347 RepID=A0AAF0QBF9_SOLVR|nr:hypothetical protein MTR67_014009 [Solanum verrucosum]
MDPTCRHLWNLLNQPKFSLPEQSTKLLNHCHYPVNRSTVKGFCRRCSSLEDQRSAHPHRRRQEWNRPLKTLNPQQDHKLMFGLLFSLKSLTAKMDPTSAEKGNLGVPQLPGQGCSFHSFRTNTYKLSFMESPSGIKIILVTHPRTGDLRESLKYIYNLYVEYVVKNPLYSPGAPINGVLASLPAPRLISLGKNYLPPSRIGVSYLILPSISMSEALDNFSRIKWIEISNTAFDLVVPFNYDVLSSVMEERLRSKVPLDWSISLPGSISLF